MIFRFFLKKPQYIVAKTKNMWIYGMFNGLITQYIACLRGIDKTNEDKPFIY